MDDQTKMTTLKAFVSEQDPEVLSAFLAIAESGLLRRLYPYDMSQTALPDCYAMTQIKYAAYLLNKRGVDFQTVHIENGVHMHFDETDIPAAIAMEITPFCGVV